MPFGNEGVEPGTGLALSGGGFRAMLFHVGATWRLNELGYLRKLKRVSSVSGGSIFAGRLAVAWTQLEFDGVTGVASNYQSAVAEPVMNFSSRLVDVPAGLTGLMPWASAAKAAARKYQKHLVGQASLQDLISEPDAPRFVFNATHFGVGATWRFSKPYMGCYRIGLVRNPAVKVATAVAASAAFPPVLSPLVLDHLDPNSFEKVEGADLYGEVKLREKAYLTDGGVYDNLGLETLWSRYQTVLVSDAGGRLGIDSGLRGLPWVSQLKRTLNVALDQGQKLRRTGFMVDINRPGRNGTIWMTSTDIARYPAASPFAVDSGWPAFMAGIRTRLNPFSETEQRRLVNWGYLVGDVAMRSWVVPQASAPQSLPFPEVDFARAPSSG